MTSLLDASPRGVMEVLRGERTVRPRANNSAAAGLRAELEDAIYGVLGEQRLATPLTIRGASLRRGSLVDVTSTALAGRVRGLLINQALRLLSLNAAGEDVFDDAMAAWRAEAGSNALLDAVDHLEPDERARLVTDVTSHWVTLRRSLGPLSTRWLPRTSLRAYQRLGGGNVILRDVVDLMVGTTTGDVASVALLDITTATLDEGDERVLRYHALVQTLRTSIVPLRTAMFSTSTGDLWCLEVDDELLTRAVADVVDVLATWRETR